MTRSQPITAHLAAAAVYLDVALEGEPQLVRADEQEVEVAQIGEHSLGLQNLVLQCLHRPAQQRPGLNLPEE